MNICKYLCTVRSIAWEVTIIHQLERAAQKLFQSETQKCSTIGDMIGIICGGEKPENMLFGDVCWSVSFATTKKKLFVWQRKWGMQLRKIKENRGCYDALGLFYS